jgi:hypothetical protein
MINPNRLAGLLKPLNFSLVIKDDSFLLFSRPDNNHAIYQQIDVEFQGKNNEAVYAYALISCTKWTLGETKDGELILDVAKDKERGWTIIENDSQATTWEASLSSSIPQRLINISINLGQTVFDKNKHAIELSRSVLPQLDSALGSLQSISLSNLFDRTTLDLASSFLESNNAMHYAGTPRELLLSASFALSALNLTKSDANALALDHDLMTAIFIVHDRFMDKFSHRLHVVD